MTDVLWEMSLEVVNSLKANPHLDQRAIIAGWLRIACADKNERLKTALWQVREDLAHLVKQIDAELEPKP